MEKEYLKSYADLYRNHWWWRAREEIIASTLHQIFPKNSGLRILDVGCGDGLLFERLSSLGQVEGIEPDADAVSATNRARGQIHICRLEEFSAPQQYDLVLLLDVLEHLENPGDYLRLALSKLSRGGRVLITVPAFLSIWTAHDVLNRHVTRYTKSSFREVAGAAGLRVDEERYIFNWVFMAKLLVRAKEAVFGSKPDVPTIPWKPMNAFLRATTILEYSLLRWLRLPFGGSLMVVGTKAEQAE